MVVLGAQTQLGAQIWMRFQSVTKFHIFVFFRGFPRGRFLKSASYSENMLSGVVLSNAFENLEISPTSSSTLGSRILADNLEIIRNERIG